MQSPSAMTQSDPTKRYKRDHVAAVHRKPSMRFGGTGGKLLSSEPLREYLPGVSHMLLKWQTRSKYLICCIRAAERVD